MVAIVKNRMIAPIERVVGDRAPASLAVSHSTMFNVLACGRANRCTL
jgi:hypothetical protein